MTRSPAAARASGCARILDRHRDDLRAVHRDHLAEVALANQPGRRAAEAGRQHAVKRGRRAATLNVAENGRAHLVPDPLRRAPRPARRRRRRGGEAVRTGPLLDDRRAADRVRAFGDHHDAERPCPCAPRCSIAWATRSSSERDLGDQDDVAAAGQPGFERDPAGVAAHHLDDHHTVVGLGRRAQPVDRIGGGGDGRIEAEGDVRGGQVVVDRLRDADDRHAELLKAQRDPHRAVAADHDQRADPQLSEPRHDLGRAIVDPLLAVDQRPDGERIAPVAGAEDGAAVRQDASHVVATERADAVRDAAGPRSRRGCRGSPSRSGPRRS